MYNLMINLTSSRRVLGVLGSIENSLKNLQVFTYSYLEIPETRR